MQLLHTLLPIFVIIFTGFITGRKGLFNDKHVEGFELFLFKIAIPCLLFNITMKSSNDDLFYCPYIQCYLVSFLIIGLIISILFWSKYSLPKILVRVLSAGYINSALYGIPILTFILGDPKAALINNIIQIVIINSIFMFLLSHILHTDQKSIFKKIMNTIRSPIIIMPILGIILSWLSISLPETFMNVIHTFGMSVNGMALFSFGLILKNVKFSDMWPSKDIRYIIFIKNFIHPFIAWLVAYYVFHLDSYWLLAIIITTSGPTALIVYLIAKQFDTDHEVVKSTVVLSSIISLMTLIVIYFVINASFVLSR